MPWVPDLIPTQIPYVQQPDWLSVEPSVQEMGGVILGMTQDELCPVLAMFGMRGETSIQEA